MIIKIMIMNNVVNKLEPRPQLNTEGQGRVRMP